MRSQFSGWLVRGGAGALVLLVAITSWQIFGRFVLNSSPSWTEQTSLLLMLWFVMLGAASGVREGYHIRIALFEQRLGQHSARWLRRGIALIVGLLGLAIMIYGAMLCWAFRDNAIPSLGINRSVAYLVLPISGALIVIFGIERMIDPRQDDDGGEG